MAPFVLTDRFRATHVSLGTWCRITTTLHHFGLVRTSGQVFLLVALFFIITSVSVALSDRALMALLQRLFDVPAMVKCVGVKSRRGETRSPRPLRSIYIAPQGTMLSCRS